MKMKAMVLHEPKRASVERVEKPDAARDGVVVAVSRAGICGTDLKIYDGAYLSPYPLIPGHEMCGTVVSVGAEGDQHWLGQRVGVDPTITCGHCYFCQSRQANHCESWKALGDTINGGFAEFVAAPSANLYPLSDDISPAIGALIEPLACAEWALERMPVRPGSTVLLFGMGPMGIILMRLLLQGGASRIVAVDLSRERLQQAEKFGAWKAVLPDELNDLSGVFPRGFDVVVDATGSVKVIRNALNWVKKGGSYLLFGVAPKGALAEVELYTVYHREITLYSSMAINQSYARAAEMAGMGILSEDLVSHILPLEQYSTAIEWIRRGEGLKIQLQP
ncbi:MAG: zinc-dependent alcohol dehydrogenase family protein [Firmicutes bacterium]|jgi:2-desacetyl-2-hydroxyethyl bacteriochlorophyllide A dehydrogenase|nr:zinc-dependent alcohol dehydrogenase family protein [Bacillota bacterium]